MRFVTRDASVEPIVRCGDVGNHVMPSPGMSRAIRDVSHNGLSPRPAQPHLVRAPRDRPLRAIEVKN